MSHCIPVILVVFVLVYVRVFLTSGTCQVAVGAREVFASAVLKRYNANFAGASH